MKVLHRPDLYAWSRFDEARNIDFHGYLWVRDGGNILFDPLPLTEHDEAHLRELGGVAWIVLTNSDHVRAAEDLQKEFGAKVAGPAGERSAFPMQCDRWMADGEELVPGLTAIAFEGSKTPGELAFVLQDTTLITGDLIRAHSGGALHFLPDAKLVDRTQARASARRLLDLNRVEAVLVGDGWPVFADGHARLAELLA